MTVVKLSEKLESLSPVQKRTEGYILNFEEGAVLAKHSVVL